MEVFTPEQVAGSTENNNKYLGVLVAAKYARALNNSILESPYRGDKLTTIAARKLSQGELNYRLVSHDPTAKR